MAEISLTFPDGVKKTFPAGSTVEDVAKSISPSLAKKSVAGKLDGVTIDYTAPIEQDGQIQIITKSDDDALAVLRDTVNLLMGAALIKRYPSIEFGESQVIENGSFLDTDNGESQVNEEDLAQVSELMNQMIKDNLPIEYKVMSKADALAAFKNTTYQKQLIEASDSDSIVLHGIGDFFDITEGAMLQKTGQIKEFKLLSVAGAYWQGKSSNRMLQRIYATAYFNADDLKADLARREEAKERDHRTLGRDLDLFFVDPDVGAGLPYWMPNGATIRRVIERYIVDKEVANGYEHVYTPILANLNLYKTSGHWDHYREDMFPPMDMGDGEELELRPMNCPSHIQIYKHHNRSYRELPVRIAELGMMHRYEKSGALSGLQRVREMTLNDGHTFVAPDQIEEEFKNILQLMMSVYEDFNITDYTFRLSYRDPENTEKYYPDDAMWEKSQTMLKSAMDDLGLKYYEATGEAAFYGPKLDVQTQTALGNDETLSTIQLDFMMPEKFELTYTGADGEEHRPVMIHRGLVSTMERFIAYLTEIYKGAFPTWLAPVQAVIIPVKADLHADYCYDIKQRMLKKGLRVEVDERNEKMGYKIREAQTHKIPYTVVVGDKELEEASVSVRRYGEDEGKSEDTAIFIDSVAAEVGNFSRDGKTKRN